jgi:16S rRNA (cytidine1402-2'-O)-methyltransferase
MEGKGILYLCATPIGNLEDITLRVLRVLKEVDIVAAEDTRHTKKLLDYYDIDTRLTSYHKFNKETKGEKLLEKLLNGLNIALVSDAGMPGISDPGYELVKLAADNNIKIIPVPGASAVLSALAVSGLDTKKFYFEGFLPVKKNQKIKILKELLNLKCTLVFYEAPHRILETLNIMHEVFGDRRAVIAREMTKKFEEFIRGGITDLITHFGKNTPKGEFTILIEGENSSSQKDVNIEWLAKEVLERTSLGAHKKEEIKKIAKEHDIPKRELYKEVLKLEDK